MPQSPLLHNLWSVLSIAITYEYSARLYSSSNGVPIPFQNQIAAVQRFNLIYKESGVIFDACLPLPFLQSFGYLVPSHQEAKVLGVVFDSATFPEHDHQDTLSTRMTVSDAMQLECPIGAFQNHAPSINFSPSILIYLHTTVSTLWLQTNLALYHVSFARYARLKFPVYLDGDWGQIGS